MGELGTLKPLTVVWSSGPILSWVMGTLSIDMEEETMGGTLKEKAAEAGAPSSEASSSEAPSSGASSGAPFS